MRFPMVALVLGLTILSSGCSRFDKRNAGPIPPPNPESAPTPEQTELEKTILKYETAMDAQLAKPESPLTVHMENIRAHAKQDRRQLQTLELRLENLENFNDQYVINMRTYIREQTIFLNWYSHLKDMFPAEVVQDRPEALNNMEKHLALETDLGKSAEDRLTLVDGAMLLKLKDANAEFRKKSTLLERAKLCVIHTRRPDGGFVRYQYLFGTIITGTRFSATGEESGKEGIYKSGIPETIFTGNLELSDAAQKSLNDIGFKNTLKVMISEGSSIDPTDDSLVTVGNWNKASIFLRTSDKGTDDLLNIELVTATEKTPTENGLILKVPVNMRGADGSKDMGTATIQISTPPTGFVVQKITVDELSGIEKTERNLKVSVSPVHGGLVVEKQ